MVILMHEEFCVRMMELSSGSLIIIVQMIGESKLIIAAVLENGGWEYIDDAERTLLKKET